MRTKFITILLSLFPLLVYAQNYEQQGDELFKQAQYEKAIKKYNAYIAFAGEYLRPLQPSASFVLQVAQRSGSERYAPA